MRLFALLIHYFTTMRQYRLSSGSLSLWLLPNKNIQIDELRLNDGQRSWLSLLDHIDQSTVTSVDIANSWPNPKHFAVFKLSLVDNFIPVIHLIANNQVTIPYFFAEQKKLSTSLLSWFFVTTSFEDDHAVTGGGRRECL